MQRHREQSLDASGALKTEDVPLDWSVIATAESVVVPGVGEVKEVAASGRVESLTAFTIP